MASLNISGSGLLGGVPSEPARDMSYNGSITSTLETLCLAPCAGAKNVAGHSPRANMKIIIITKNRPEEISICGLAKKRGFSTEDAPPSQYVSSSWPYRVELSRGLLKIPRVLIQAVSHQMVQCEQLSRCCSVMPESVGARILSVAWDPAI